MIPGFSKLPYGDRLEHWDFGILLKNIKLIEGVQRHATKLVIGMQGLNYNDWLNSGTYSN